MKKKVKQVKKAVKKIARSVSLERERVNYVFDNKKFSIRAEFKSHNVVITRQQIAELVNRKDDMKRFYSFCNSEIQLLSRLHADAQAKKLNECKNTQYDSRKKLNRLIIHIALTVLKQKAKSKVKKVKR